jgi:RNA polymerase sigma factor (sigma-70 family)
MSAGNTTAQVQACLDELRRHRHPESVAPAVRDLLERAADRLQMLCSAMLHRQYPRLSRPPLNLRAEEMLSAVAERLLRSLHEVRPEGTRQFFALVNRHLRWELNDLARRLDEQSAELVALDEAALAPEPSDAVLDLRARRILEAIDRLPPEEREVFELVRIQGLGQAEVAELTEVSTKTVQRRLSRGLLRLAEQLGDVERDGG